MNVKYTKLPKEEAPDHYQPVRRSSDSNITDETGGVAGGLTRIASLPTEYSRLHGFLRRLSSRRRAASERPGRTSTEQDNTIHDSETDAVETIEYVATDDDAESHRNEGVGSYKYKKLNHVQLYRTQSDDVFNNNNHPVMVK